ncbi:DUF4386 domain-containing protein [Hymenobacter sp. BT175]|uniref:DUF4386 domain-containing protein n=1 Tax=Hymenobacter translucens TaxID=2886507 RepID=UPI001D0E7986|nr:DUF4386 domain-containing protein [Hymenobacter translucens]MCC2546600.1 DUF4386 domain-containing protein [Hymenobacter translucens]
MTVRPIEASPQSYARLGGALYLVIIVFGAFAEGFITSKLVVSGNAAATGRNILAAPLLWQLGVAANLLLVFCAVPLLWIEYLLLRPVSKSLVLLAVLLNVVSLAVEAMSKVFMLLVMRILKMGGLEALQQMNLANLALKAHDVSFNVALLFFGLTCLLNGYLIYQSGYFPRVIGTLMQVAGACYLVSCTAALFAPALADLLIPAILLPCLVGESSLCLWLLIKGVNRARWDEAVSRGPGV